MQVPGLSLQCTLLYMIASVLVKFGAILRVRICRDNFTQNLENMKKSIFSKSIREHALGLIWDMLEPHRHLYFHFEPI